MGKLSGQTLRLAEEYRTYFGQTAIDEFIRTRVQDGAWRPGDTHRMLLELPWADVLTTNWDTLLERAAREVSARDYEPVRIQADTAHARAPRIVKLHGSLGTTDHFIVAEEDYRTYPERFAIFVNLVRQIFIENELCLLGFSGDDPNFLQWSGWVRDKIGDSARRIYLIGALNLGPAKRKLLEARNIAPIDLAPLVSELDRDEQQGAAARLFLKYLIDAEPTPIHRWQPRSYAEYTSWSDGDSWQRAYTDNVYGAELLDRAARAWKVDRASFPGWLICPAEERQSLNNTFGVPPHPTVANLALLSEERRSQVLYELAWRYSTSLRPLDGGIAELLTTVGDPANKVEGLTRKQQLEIAVLLLRTARENEDDVSFERWAIILKNSADVDGDFVAEEAYQRCIRARNRLDLSSVTTDEQVLRSARDSIWRLRLASLFCDCGDFKEAKSLVDLALAELRVRQREDRRSLWVRSRLAWAQWFSRAMRTDDFQWTSQELWGLEYRAIRCDPWVEIETVARDAERELRKKRQEDDIVPLFQPGHYKDPSKTIRFGVSAPEPAYVIDRIAEVAGVPLRLQHLSIYDEVARDSADLSFKVEASSL